MYYINKNPVSAKRSRSLWPRGVLSLLLSGSIFLVSGSLDAQTRNAPPNKLGGPLIVLSALMDSQAPSLGEAAQFAVLGGSTVTNTGPSAISGDLGVAPGTAITGIPPGVVIGTVHSNDPVAMQAQNAVTTAYNELAGEACDTDLTGQDLGGLTLTPGVYCFSSSAQLTGTLTLDAEGNPNSVFIFQIGSTITTASAASVNLINGADACNVFWQVGSSATLGSGTSFVGNVIALASITIASGASLSGRALARTGAVTLDTNKITGSGTSSASWSNYGAGWPGTLGVPSLMASADPVIGTTFDLAVQNSYGLETCGCLLCGVGPASTPTSLGGTLLVEPPYIVVNLPPIPPGGLLMPVSVPLDPSLVCVKCYAQVFQLDPGASYGVSFTPGLELAIGR